MWGRRYRRHGRGGLFLFPFATGPISCCLGPTDSCIACVRRVVLLHLNSMFYFIWLEQPPQKAPPLDPAAPQAGNIGGEVWRSHAGVFLQREKKKSLNKQKTKKSTQTAKNSDPASAETPSRPELHCKTDFQVGAYTTLLSTGLASSCSGLVYYNGRRIALIESAVMALSQPEAIAPNRGLPSWFWAGWSMHGSALGLLRRGRRRPVGLAVPLIARNPPPGRSATCLPAAAPTCISRAMLCPDHGLNVTFFYFRRSSPGQRDLVIGKRRCRRPDPKVTAPWAARRSVHNNLLHAKPVLFT